MVHNYDESGYDIRVPYLGEAEMITVGHPDAELLKVFLLKDEKAAFKELAAELGQPMYHLVRQMILRAISEKKR
jgi:hypothetical protein